MISISHLRIKPLALACGHGRYTTVTPDGGYLFPPNKLRTDISEFHLRCTLGECFIHAPCPHNHNHAHRPRLEKIPCPELSRSPLLDPGGGFTSEAAVRRHQKRDSRCVTILEAKQLQIYSGCITPNGHSPMEKSVRSGVTVM